MKIENTFDVEAPIDVVWNYLLDLQHVAACAPGAELTETVDDTTSKGKVNVKLGPISMSFAGTVVIQERDEAAHRAVLKADGREQRGKGSASALVTATMASNGPNTTVHIETDLTITGAAAQYGRGMIGDISQRMTTQFADCLRDQIAASQAGGAPAPEVAVAETPSPEAASPEPSAAAPATGMAPSSPPGASPAPATPAAQPAPRSGPPPKPAAVEGFRLFAWALWRAVVRFFQRFFGGSRPSGGS
jgi:carbon monoxide dehydrogenase subunit G